MLLMIPSDVMAAGSKRSSIRLLRFVRPVPPQLSLEAAKAGFPGVTASSFWSRNLETFTSPNDPLPRSIWGLDVVVAWQGTFTAVTHYGQDYLTRYFSSGYVILAEW